jgi:dephospho-CoA kinase
MLVLGIVGPKGAGKDTSGTYIAKRYNGRLHSHSEILDDVLAVLHIPNTRDNEIKLVALRTTFGPDTLIKALNKKIKAEQTELVVVTGIRFDNELENIRSYPRNKVIYINALPEKRFEWIQKRGQKPDDADMTYQKFMEIETKVTEVHTKELGEKADFKIENNGSEQELFKKIDEIMQKIL